MNIKLDNEHMQPRLEVSRTVALCWLADTLGKRFVLEQPLGSLMERHPRFAQMRDAIDIIRHSTAMERFDSDNRKPTWLYSNCETISGIDVYAPPLPLSSPSSTSRVISVSYQDWLHEHEISLHAINTK